MIVTKGTGQQVAHTITVHIPEPMCAIAHRITTEFTHPRALDICKAHRATWLWQLCGHDGVDLACAVLT